MTCLKYSLFFAFGLLSTLGARVWRDTYGHSVEAEFVRMSEVFTYAGRMGVS